MDSVMISLAMEAAALSESWQARDLLLGRRATVLIGDRTLVGQGRGIDAEGRLWLALDDGSLEAVVAGQVLRESP
jgi:biotin-(acetyl-CoA carboxylase) ligase